MAKDAEAQKKDIAEMLVERDLILDEQLGQLIAQVFNVPFIDLSETNVEKTTLALIPEVVARARGLLAFAKSPEGVKLALTNPSDLEMRAWLEKKTGMKAIPYYATPRDFQKALIHYQEGPASALKFG